MKSTSASLFSILIHLFFILLFQPAFPINTSPLIKGSDAKTLMISKEKIYIHFDKAFYNLGENIWYKIYLVDAINHEPKTLSSIVYVDLIDPNSTIIDSKTIKINKGSGNGDFKLPRELLSGEYTIRAYTNYMRNFDSVCFFRKTIRIDSGTQEEITHNINKNFKDELNISFFPEGGNIVSGFVNSIGFKAINEEGKGVNISGSILDETDKTIRTFKASKLGQGMFQFIPQKEKNYKAIVSYKGKNYTYKLPSIIDHGILMRVNQSNNFFRINIYSSLLNSKNNLKLIGLQKGVIVCQTELSGNKSEIAINVPKSDLKHGLVEFNLLDKNDIILSKELAFSDSVNSKQCVTIKASKNVYGKNEMAEVDISLSEIIQKNSVANMSITVTEALSFKNAAYSSDIKSHLYLTSEILGNIKQPSYYLYSNDSQRKNNLTILLRSQDINQNSFKDNIKGSELKFMPESGYNLKGMVKEIHKNKPVKASVTVTYKNNNEIGHDKTITDSLGRFSFNGLNFEERTFVAIKAKRLNAKNYSSHFTIVLDSFIPPLVNTKRVPEKHTKKGNTFLEPKIKQNRNTEFAPRKGEIKLNEVKLNAYKKRKDRYTEKRKSALYTSPHHTLDVKNSRFLAPNPLLALSDKFPGFEVRGPTLIIRGRRFHELDDVQPLFLIDGFPASRESFTGTPLFDVDFIDIIKGAQTAIYGSRGAGIIIALYTLDGSEENEELNNRNVTISFYHPGYYQARKFYQDENNPSTLYWNPDLKLEQPNTTKIAFNTANKSATYKVLLEGITSNGMPFKAEAYFDVK